MLLYAAASIPREGEIDNGDLVYARVGETYALFAVVDALGHGKWAAEVALRAEAALALLPEGTRAADALWAVHDALRSSRGAVATLCSWHDGELCIAGVGNVECSALGLKLSFAADPGVLGVRVRRLRSTNLRPPASARFALWSDGIRSHFDREQLRSGDVERACAWLMDHQRRPTDDASVLVFEQAPGAPEREPHLPGRRLA